MKKYFICLANSYKHGNRCIAGVEVNYDDAANTYELVTNSYGNPTWFRPINPNTDGGAIPNDEAMDIKLFDLVEATDVVSCPSGAQVENFSYKSLKIVGSVSSDIQDIRSFCDANRKTIFGNKGGAVIPDDVDRIGYSIIMLEPQKVEFYLKDRQHLNKIPQPRAIIHYNDIEYDFPVTDPDFRHQIEESVEKSNSYKSYFLTLSLGVENEGWHSKLVAGVIALDYSDETISNTDSGLGNIPRANASQLESFSMFNSGLSVSEISSRRGLSENTVYSHLIFFVEKGFLDALKLVPEETITIVAKFKDENPNETSLKAYYTGLEEKVSYNDLKVVLAYLKR